MSVLIAGLDMPQKTETIVIQPDGRVWRMSGREHPMKAMEIKTPHGNLIDRSKIGLSDFEIVMCGGENG